MDEYVNESEQKKEKNKKPAIDTTAPMHKEAGKLGMDSGGEDGNEKSRSLFSEDLERREKERLRWETAGGFHERSGDSKNFVGHYGAAYDEDYGALDIYGLRDVLKNDNKKKSEKFNDMYESLNSLLETSTNVNRSERIAENIDVDFTTKLFEAKQAVHEYASARRSSIHVFPRGGLLQLRTR